MAERLKDWWANRYNPPGLSRLNALAVMAFGGAVLIWAIIQADPFATPVLAVGSFALIALGVANRLPPRYRGVTASVNSAFWVFQPVLVIALAYLLLFR